MSKSSIKATFELIKKSVSLQQTATVIARPVLANTYEFTCCAKCAKILAFYQITNAATIPSLLQPYQLLVHFDDDTYMYNFSG